MSDNDWKLPTADLRGKIVKVHDGDTATVLQRDGSLANIRLANIDAPELLQQGGSAARDRLRGLIYGRNLNIAVAPDTTYNRAVGTLTDRNDVNYNLGQVRSGNATAYEQFLRDPAALQAQADAKAAQAGFWGTGGPQDAAAYRHAQPQSMPIAGGTQNGLRGSSIDDTIEYLRNPRVIQDLKLDGGKSNQPSDDPTFDIAMQYRKDHGDFRRGLHSSIEGMKAGLNRTKAAALEASGDVAGAKALYDIAKSQEVEAGITAPKRFTEVKGVGEAIDWAQGAAGQGLASVGPVLAGALAAKLGLRKTALEGLAPFLGAGVPSFGMQVGENMSNFQNNEKNTLSPGETLAAAAATALPQAALDSLMPGGMVSKQALKVIMEGGKKAALKHMTGEAIKGAAEEGLTEGAQELVGQAGENLLVDSTKGYDPRALLDSAAAGAVGGGMFSAAGGARDVMGAQRMAATPPPAMEDGAPLPTDGGLPPAATDTTPALPYRSESEDFTLVGGVYPPLHQRQPAPSDEVAGLLPRPDHEFAGSDLPDPTLREAPAPAVTDMTPKADVGKNMLEQADAVVAASLGEQNAVDDWHSHTPEEKAQLVELIRDKSDDPKVLKVLSHLFGSIEKVNEVSGTLRKLRDTFSGANRETAATVTGSASLDDDGAPTRAATGDLDRAARLADEVHGLDRPFWHEDARSDKRASQLNDAVRETSGTLQQFGKQTYLKKQPFMKGVENSLKEKYPLVKANDVDSPEFMEQFEQYHTEMAAAKQRLTEQAKEALVARGADPDEISPQVLEQEIQRAYVLAPRTLDHRPGDFTYHDIEAMKVKRNDSGRMYTDGRIDVNMTNEQGEVKAVPISLHSLVMETAKKRGADGDHGNLSTERITSLVADGITTLMNQPNVSKSEPFGKVEGGKPAISVDPETGEMTFNLPDDTLVARIGGREVRVRDLRNAPPSSAWAYEQERKAIMEDYELHASTLPDEPGTIAAARKLRDADLAALQQANGDVDGLLAPLRDRDSMMSESDIEDFRSDVAEKIVAGKAEGATARAKFLGKLLGRNKKQIESLLERKEAAPANTIDEGAPPDGVKDTGVRTYQEETGEQLKNLGADLITPEQKAAQAQRMKEATDEHEAEQANGLDHILKQANVVTELNAAQQDTLAFLEKLGEHFMKGFTPTVKFVKKLPGKGRGIFYPDKNLILLDANMQPAKLLSVAAHEFGHALQARVFDMLSPSDPVRQALVREWYKQADKVLSGAEHKDYAQEFLDAVQAARYAKDSTAAIERLRKHMQRMKAEGKPEFYALDFNEWFANQMSKYITSNAAAGSNKPAVRAFWANAAKTLRALFDFLQRIAGKLPAKPNQAFVDYIESLDGTHASGWKDNVPAIELSPKHMAALKSDLKATEAELEEMTKQELAEDKAKTERDAHEVELGLKDADALLTPEQANSEVEEAKAAAGKQRKADTTKINRRAGAAKARAAKLRKFMETLEAEGDTKHSNQPLGAQPMSAAQAAEVEQMVLKMFGGRVTARVEQFMKDAAGKYSREAKIGADLIKKVLRVSAFAIDPRATAYHEALHAFVHELGQMKYGEQITRALHKAASSAPIMNQLKERLKGQPEALKQLEDPEERIAYMFQFYSTDPSFNFGDQTSTIFDRMKKLFRDTLGIWSANKRAVEIMEYLKSGLHAEGYNMPNTVHRSLMENGNNKYLQRAEKAFAPVIRAAKTLALPGDWVMRGTQIPALKELAQLIHPTTGEAADEGYLQAVTRQAGARFASMAEHFIGTSEQTRANVIEALQRGNLSELSPEERKLAQAVRAGLDSMYRYMSPVLGNALGNRGYGKDYFPRVWDREAIMKNRDEFIALLTKHGVEDPETTASYMMNEGFTDIAGGQDEVLGYTPAMAAANARTLHMITGDEAAPFLKKDLIETLHDYTRQAVKRTEYVRRFGERGEKLSTLLGLARKQGATGKELQAAKKYIQAAQGTLGYDIDPQLRDIAGGLIVYENIRLLPLAIFSSIVDPIGLAVRSGDMRDAFTAFRRGVTEVRNYMRKTPNVTDDLAQLAIDIGVMEHNVMMDAYQLTQSSDFLNSKQKKIQDAFFKYNAMSGWNHSMRTAATGSAINFITRHSLDPTKHSARYMEELGLTADDLHYADNGGLLVRKEEILAAGGTEAQADKLHAAIHRYVDGAVLRPNAAHRPIWMSDPHYALFAHLKQFTYSFHQTILKRASLEMKNGNYAVLAPLLSYIPVSVAAAYMKGVIQAGGDDPEWKRGWGPANYVWDGTQRAGLLGIRQFGIDIETDAMNGGSGIGTIIGPTFDHLTDIARDIGAGKAKHATIDSLPANDLYGATLMRALN